MIGLTRRPPFVEPGDPAIGWQVGDLRDPTVRKAALRNVRAVFHAAGWVNLGIDRSGNAAAINVDATRDLLTEASAAGVERFVFTSTLHTLAAGTAEKPADEQTPWNLHTVDAPYSRTKREAERLVMSGTDRLAGVALCPGMVIGPRGHKPTSTRVLLVMAGTRVAFLPRGGIPVVDTAVIAEAHRAALDRGEPGTRYAVVGPYLSYHDMAKLVAQVTGRPWAVLPIPGVFERPLTGISRVLERFGVAGEVSPAAVAGGFLQLHVRGDRADRAFGLVHPAPLQSICTAMEDAHRAGRASWLKLRPPST